MEKLKKYKMCRYEIAEKEAPHINIETVKGEVRIYIKEKYKKAGIKYYIFTTNISDSTKFVLSEYEYDKYIGRGNNVADYTAWRATCKSNILAINCPSGMLYEYPDIYYDVLEMCKNVDGIKADYGCHSENITYAYGSSFKEGELEIVREIIEEKLFKMRFLLESRLNVNRYSFLGGKPFAENELKEYEKVLTKLNNDLADYFMKNIAV